MSVRDTNYLIYCADKWEEVARNPNKAELAAVGRVAKLYERSHFHEAEFLRLTFQPDSFRTAAECVRRLLQADEIDKARLEVDRFTRNIEYAQALFFRRLAVTGLNQHKRVDRMRGDRNETVQRETKQRHASWQQEAERLWKCHPEWGRPAVAERVAPTLGGKPDTIRKVIKKPGTTV